MNEILIYRCPVCGNILYSLYDSGAVPLCCGQEMDVLTAHVLEGFAEKHLPVVSCEGNMLGVRVGSTLHPQTDAHGIRFILLVTDKGRYFRPLETGVEPETVFLLREDETPLAVYAWCNLHGLWEAAV